MRSALLRFFAGLLLLSWTAALAHVAQESCGAATAGLAATSDTSDGDAEGGHCAHGAVGDFAGGKFSGGAGGKVFFALPAVIVMALVLSLLLPAISASGGGWERELLDPGGGPVGWFIGGRPAHPVRGPSIRV